ncbi:MULTISPECIES: PaaX family transcriptional regulator C-terminal domain-containing protein [unclassified Streptomyces]|uniref:PaaX family transcriptional regulator C-terminal domain-containing protein n=1 Tax=unclassified Streptomyces TaxID=2593676 RepID=UPI0022B6F0B8|nr:MULTISPECIES: PaaX family transcriptional regulator C-terminal domain-containing protein [unclassified Streptomyces]MCZ7416742.1 transcriptional regulator [Streptomyces sp. WMMC897]MCZ7433448.1 transcriptional regulator [Streptomyces sp. WMMC1477]
MTDGTTSNAAEPTPPQISTRTLVFALLREDGTVDAGELYTVAGALAMTDQQVRLCVKRLVAEGRFTQEGRGRKAVLHATADPTGVIAPEVEYVRHAYVQDRGLAPWDGTWHLYAFAVPETARQARDALRDTLLHLGAAPLQGGLYVTANAIGPVVEAHARHLDVLPSLTRLTTRDLRVGDEDDPVRLAALLWPLQAVADRHEDLAALATARLARLTGPVRPTPTERLTYAIELATAFTAAMRPDPLLPPELLPRPWAGTRARALTAECWHALREEDDHTRGGLRLFRLYDDSAG